MTTREKITQERLEALLDVIESDGVTPPGEVSAAHVSAIRAASELGQPREVARRHAQGQKPPKWATRAGDGGKQ